MVLTDALSKEIASDIERCKSQVEIADSEALYNDLMAKYGAIGLNLGDGLPHYKVAVRGSGFDFRPEIRAIADKLDMWLKVWSKEAKKPMGPEEKIREFIERGEVIGKGEFHPLGNGYPPHVDGPNCDAWMDEIYIFSCKYLKGHPLFDKIMHTFETREKGDRSYDDMMGYLRAINNTGVSFAAADTGESVTPEFKTPALAGNKVFIVHGHDGAAKQEVARVLEKADFHAIILHEQPSGGQTIIEKIEANTDVAFAVVLYTPCDLGRAREQEVEDERGRARQNVVFEHGYLIGKLGRSHVCALVKDGVETPGDISGVVYVPMDEKGAWKFELAKEMRAVGLNIDTNKLL